MSGGNCPETPRQKMIGMMYLFLTAMLALNVSGDLLNAFRDFDKGFKDSSSTMVKKSNVLYTQFEVANASNPAKVEEYWKKAQGVRSEATELVQHIEDLKYRFAREISGEEATPENYQGIDNQDVAPQIMITEGNGKNSKELKAAIESYKNGLIANLDPDDPSDTTLISALNTTFYLGDVKGDDKGEMKSWESSKFEHVPLAASMASLSKLQADVRNAEGEVVSYLYDKINAKSFKFTSVAPIIIPENRTIVKGDKYRARILMAAYDTTDVPQFTVGGKILDVQDGMAILELPANSVGGKDWNGEIVMTQPDGVTKKTYKITDNYNVVSPSAVISPTKMNVFYAGVANPVGVSVPGFQSKDLKISATNVGGISASGRGYIVKPPSSSIGKKSIISVSAKVGDKLTNMGSQEFRIKRIPDPVAQIGGKSGGKIAKNALIAQTSVFAKMKDFDFDLTFKVTRFTVSAVKGGFIQDETSNSGTITAAQKQLIKGMGRGSKVSFENIRAVGPDGSPRDLGTVTFVLD